MKNKIMNGFWNYRFLAKPVYKNDEIAGYYYEMVEVYYDSNKNIVAWSDETETVTVDSKKDLKRYINFIKEASKRTVLEIVDGSIKDTNKKMIESVDIYG